MYISLGDTAHRPEDPRNPLLVAGVDGAKPSSTPSATGVVPSASKDDEATTGGGADLDSWVEPAYTSHVAPLPSPRKNPKTQDVSVFVISFLKFLLHDCDVLKLCTLLPSVVLYYFARSRRVGHMPCSLVTRVVLKGVHGICH